MTQAPGPFLVRRGMQVAKVWRTPRGKPMAKQPVPKKCANPTCDCITEDGSKYCSAHCEGTLGHTELVCHCGHDGCSADVSGRKVA